MGIILSAINTVSNKIYISGLCLSCKIYDTFAMGQLKYNPSSDVWSIEDLDYLIYQYSYYYKSYFTFIKNTQQPMFIMSGDPTDIPGLFQYSGIQSIKYTFSIFYDLIILILILIPLIAVVYRLKTTKKVEL